MCVIAVADKRRPTPEEIEKMDNANSDGNGIAWREMNKDKTEKIVRWEKGLSLDAVQTLAEKVPMPFVLHFRIATFGGRSRELTHPFPVEKEMRQDLSGSIKGFVLFHNGSWHRYKDCGIDGAIKNRVKVPDGKWSDTRVMAWLAHMHGPNILELIDEKVILFGTDKIEIFHPDGWARVNDLLVSNRSWEHSYVRKGNGYTKDNTIDLTDTNYDYMVASHARVGCCAPNCNKNRISPSYYCAEHQGNCKLCNKVKMVGSDYCDHHGPNDTLKCKVVNCHKTKIIGSEHCPEHQPLCADQMCDKPREFGEKYCLKHLSLKGVTKALENKQPLPFRSSTEAVSTGNDKLGGAGSIRTEVGSVVKGGTNPIKDAELSWACSLNPKPIKTPTLFNRVAQTIHETVM